MTKRLTAGLALMAAASATTAGAANWVVSTQNVETVSVLTSQPLPKARGGTGYVVIGAEVKFEEEGGSIVLRLGPPDAPGIVAVFGKNEIMLATDGDVTGDFAQAQTSGESAYAFRICVHKIEQTTRHVKLQIRDAKGNYQTVASMDWPPPLLPEQEPMAWLATGEVAAGFAGFCAIGNFTVSHVVPGTIFLIN